MLCNKLYLRLNRYSIGGIKHGSFTFKEGSVTAVTKIVFKKNHTTHCRSCILQVYAQSVNI